MLKRNVNVLSKVFSLILLGLLLCNCSVMRSGDGLKVPEDLQQCKPTYRSRYHHVIDKEIQDDKTGKMDQFKAPSTVFSYTQAQKEFADEVGCLMYQEYMPLSSNETVFISFYVESTNTLFFFSLQEKSGVIVQYSFAMIDENSMLASMTFFLPFKEALDFFGKKSTKEGIALQGPEGVLPMSDFNELLKELSDGKLPLK